VVVVDASLAEQFWPGEIPVGKRLRMRGPNAAWLTVIGVAQDVLHYGVEREPRPGLYLPFALLPQPFLTIVIRSDSDPTGLLPAVRNILKRQDPTLAPAGVALLSDLVRGDLWLRQACSVATLVFAAVALALATVGAYGVSAYAIGRRTREVGVRLALGAPKHAIFGLLLRDSLRLVATGLVLGLPGGLVLAALPRVLFAGVDPLNPVVYAVIVALLGSAVLLAALVPARRATQVNVVDVLRFE
jgi:hypothetical protein